MAQLLKKAQALRKEIEAAFPDAEFKGSITPVDGDSREELDEELALHNALAGKRWSQIPESFVERHPDGIALLTDEAFVAFVAAWLIYSLGNEKAREMLVYFFSPDVHGPSKRRDRRISRFSSHQKKAIGAFLSFCVEVEASDYIKKHAQSALKYLSEVSGGSS